MVLPIRTALSFLLAAATSAMACDISGSIGTGFGPYDNNLTLYNAIEEINESPSATSEIKFPFLTTRYGSSQQSSTWTWRVNITDINVDGLPERPGYLRGNHRNPHFVNTVHSLEWPGGGNLSNELATLTNNASASSPAGRLCLTVLSLPDLPPNVTNNYSEDDNGDCSNVLGYQCAQAYLASASASISSCDGPDFPKSIRECNNTLATATCYGAATFQLGNTTKASFTNVTDSSMIYPIQSGDGVFYSASGAQDGGNNSYYQNATQQLQVILLTGTTNQIFCQKVGKTDIMTSTASASMSGPYYAIPMAFGLIMLLTTLL